jgi:hypothetical protein
MAPSRPAVLPEQMGLLVFTLVAVAAGLYLVVRVVLA